LFIKKAGYTGHIDHNFRIKMLKLTLHELEVFVAISQSGTMRAAGQQMGLSQSAASAPLAELERRLGTQLFNRVGRGIVLNEYGRALLPRAMNMLQQAYELESDFSLATVSHLRIASSQTIGNVLMPGLLQALIQQLPAIRCELDIINSELVIERLLECRVDFGLIEAPYTDPRLVFEPWLEDELVVYACAGHPLSMSLPDMATLSRAAWILREQGSGVRRVLESRLLPQLGSINVLLELGSGEAINEAVRCGLGISCASRRSLSRELQRGEFVVLPTPGVDLSRQFSLVWHAERQLSMAAERLRRICHERAQESSGKDKVTE